VDISVAHPLVMVLFLVLTAVSFSLFGFILGIWADGWEKLTIVPILVIMPLTFLGGTFYSISMLPPMWQTISLFNPLVYLVSGFRWSFYENADVSVALSLGMTIGFLAYENADVSVALSLGMTIGFLAACLLVVRWIFRSGYKLRN
jgi:ABC-2 type transport system permease protein